MYRLPPFIASPAGLASWALVAEAPSPCAPDWPFPAIVVIVPLAAMPILLHDKGHFSEDEQSVLNQIFALGLLQQGRFVQWTGQLVWYLQVGRTQRPNPINHLRAI